jgi:hypothetical protein
MQSAVGSFTKSTGAATANQSVTGLPFAPTVVFLWMAGNTSQDAWATDTRFAFGFADANEGRSVGGASQDAQNFSNATRRFATKALSIVEWGESVLAECDLTLTGDGFDLAWTTNNAVAYHINYLAINPANAEIVDWDHNTTGNKSVTGAGFTPELVIHLSATAQASTTTEAQSSFMLGAMTSAAQWGIYTADADNQNTTINTGVTITDGCIVRQVLTSMAIDIKAAYSSMDADGFTVNFSALGSQRFFSSLCLAGDDFAVGTEVKTTSAATASESITGPGFEPAAVLLAINANCVTSGTGTQHHRFGIGGSDGTNERAAAVSSQDNIGTSVVDSYMASAKAVVKNNNATAATDAEADLAMTATGFDLSWTTNDAVATLVPWIAFGPAGTNATGTITVGTATGGGGTHTGLAAVTATTTASDSTATGQALTGTVSYTGTITASDSTATGQTVTGLASATGTITAGTATSAGGDHTGTADTSADATGEVTAGTATGTGGSHTGSAGALATMTAGEATATGTTTTGTAGTTGTLTAGDATATGMALTGDDGGVPDDGESGTGTSLRWLLLSGPR